MRDRKVTAFVCISIHAPVKGATLLLSGVLEVAVISIHAPVKGATIRHVLDVYPTLISIHAPVKGATHGQEELSDE